MSRPIALLPAQVERIKRARLDGVSLAELGEQYGLSKESIRRVCRGLTGPQGEEP